MKEIGEHGKQGVIILMTAAENDRGSDSSNGFKIQCQLMIYTTTKLIV